MSDAIRFRLSAEASDCLDLLIVACGYESRSLHVAKVFAVRAKRVLAFAFPIHRVHSFARNFEELSKLGRVEEPSTLEEFVSSVRVALDSLSGDTPLSIGLDVSSFDRERLAILLTAVAERARRSPLSLTLLYAPGKYVEAAGKSEQAVMVNGPLAQFAGWTPRADMPVACVVGLGFEYQAALAALETLEPAQTITYLTNDDEIFRARVGGDNVELLESHRAAVVSYQLADPVALFRSLEGVVHSLLAQYRVVILPLGPKLFAATSLLVALLYGNEVAVWRVSGGAATEPTESEADGTVVALCVQFESGGAFEP